MKMDASIGLKVIFYFVIILELGCVHVYKQQPILMIEGLLMIIIAICISLLFARLVSRHLKSLIIWK